MSPNSPRANRAHMLWVKTELLHPLDKGGRIRTHGMLRELRRRFRITYVCLDDGGATDEALAQATEYCDAIIRVPFQCSRKGSLRFYLELLRNGLSRLPYAVWKYRSPQMTRIIERLVALGDVDLVVCDFLAPSVNVPKRPGLPTVLFQHNVEATIWKRHTEIASGAARLYFREQHRRIREHERAECRRFDHVVAVSEEDATVFRDEYGARSVSTVCTGVDTGYFRPSALRQRAPHELVFTGSMDWMPNEDAVCHFVEEILPRVRQRIPDVTFTVVGRAPRPRVTALASSVAGVRVTGRVEDVRPFVDHAAAFIVPMRIAGGTRLKIFEAMAMECPVISTRVGAEGLPLIHGENAMLADDPASFANAVVDVLSFRTMADRLTRAAALLVREHFSWETAAREFADSCTRVAFPEGAGPPSVLPRPARLHRAAPSATNNTL